MSYAYGAAFGLLPDAPEGDAAATYFRGFAALLAPASPEAAGQVGPFHFETRNRRPPSDPVNAMLSLAYAMLARHLTIALAAVGLDPFRGFYHQPRYGRPALRLPHVVDRHRDRPGRIDQRQRDEHQAESGPEHQAWAEQAARVAAVLGRPG